MTVTSRHLMVVMAALALLAAAPAASAQDDPQQPTGQSFMTPFPEGDVYRIQVYGDPYGDGLVAGLSEAFANDNRVQIQRRSRALGPLVRPDWEDEIKQEEASREPVHAAVLIIGLLDRQALRSGSGTRPIQFGNDDWQIEWGRRLDRTLRMLKKRAGAVYVLSQPPLRRPEANRDAELVTETIRDRAQVSGVRFIDISEGFQDESGNYIQFGADVGGARQRLREGDGVTMSPSGNRKLAWFVERELRRDITQAQNERTIPLAGSEAEQKKINPATAAAAAPAAQWKSTVNRAARTEAAQAPQQAAADTSGDQKADNGRVQFRVAASGGREETVTLDIVRPAIPAAVVALLTRRDVSDRAQQPGEAVIEDVGGGLAVMNSVSSLGPGAAPAARNRVQSGGRPYMTVLVRGERLPTKPGRADDFAWPRAEFVPPQPVAAGAAPAPAPVRRGTARGNQSR